MFKRALSITFRNKLFLTASFVPPRNQQAGAPPIVCCPLLLTQYIPSYSPYFEAMSCIYNLRTGLAVVTGHYVNVVNANKYEVKTLPEICVGWFFNKLYREK
jgi:hypothetical protein